MLSIFLTALSGVLLILMGFYFGHQIGSTRHIRENLAKIRTKNRD